MTRAPWSIDYAGHRFALVHPRERGLRCEMCGDSIRHGNGCYRTQRWGPSDLTIYMHQRCLIGQIDPTIFDIH